MAAREERTDGASSKVRPIRWAVVGAGHIAQVAVLPAFRNAENSELVALISGDPDKRRVLQERYDIEHVLDYEAYDAFLASGLVDAVYIALPNHVHRDYTIRAARNGVHVLCEKPMAVTERDCEEMIRAADDHHVKLMIGYRLHFERGNLEAIDIVDQGELGEPRFFGSVFSQDVKEGDIRLNSLDEGGGSVYDVGVYCINAARSLFRDEPLEVTAYSAGRDDPRFELCDEMTTAVLRFPGERLATFTSCFGAHAISRYEVVGTRGRLVMEPAFEYATEIAYRVETDDGHRERRLEKRDQFAPELIYFSDCIRQDREPEPGGLAGLADVHIIRAVYESAAKGRSVRLLPIRQPERPDLSQAITRPGFDKPGEIHASSPTSR